MFSVLKIDFTVYSGLWIASLRLVASGGSGVYIWGRQWGGHNCSWGARTYTASV